MPSVVLHVESDARRDQAQKHGQGKCLPPGLGEKHQQYISGRETGEQDGGLQIHLPTIALALASTAKELIHPPLQGGLKASIFAEF